MKTKRPLKNRRDLRPKLPPHIWADYDPHAGHASARWAFYTSKADQRSNRPDLQPLKIKVTYA